MNKVDFLQVKEKGKFLTLPYFSVSYLKNNTKESRFGFVVSKKISMKATVRNRIKRLMKEAIRINMEKLPKGYDFVVLAKSGIVHKTFGTIETDLIKAMNSL